MSEGAGRTFGLIGALSAFPRRAIAREVSRQGGELQHRVTRRTTCVVFGRTLLAKLPETEIEKRWEAYANSHRILSERGFLRALGLFDPPGPRSLPRQAILDQARLPERVFQLLSLFDAFEADGEPFTFHDLILARKYAALLGQGASWSGVAKSIHRSSAPSSLTSLTLHGIRSADTVYARFADGLSELDGQALLPLEDGGDFDLEEMFLQAECAEEAGAYLEAAALYQKCLDGDTTDAVASFNRANCLKKAGVTADARNGFLRAIKIDPKFVEAWFNLGCLAIDAGNPDAARNFLKRAIELDRAYGDAVYNLASVEFAAGDYGEARKLWSRYLQLDADSDWARMATRGIHYADRQLNIRSVR